MKGCLACTFGGEIPRVPGAIIKDTCLSWFGLGKRQVPTKIALPLPLLSWTGERKYDERLEGRDKERDHSPITVTDKTD